MADFREELQAGRPDGPAALTFGVFDGVHLGHLHVLRQLRDDARERGLTPVIVTLSNHPLSVLRPQVPLVLISSLKERLALLRAAGIDHVIPITFTRELSRYSAREFMRTLCEDVGLRHFVAGPDFALGHDREGTMSVLGSIGEELGYTVRTAGSFSLDGAPVRSTAVRQALSAGDIEEAGRLLGRALALDGSVVEGGGRGGGGALDGLGGGGRAVEARGGRGDAALDQAFQLGAAAPEEPFTALWHRVLPTDEGCVASA